MRGTASIAREFHGMHEECKSDNNRRNKTCLAAHDDWRSRRYVACFTGVLSGNTFVVSWNNQV